MTDYFPRNPIYSAIRSLFAVIDQVVYFLMSILYEIFFAVAGVDFLSGDVIRSIYSRVQIILGVFMIFKLAVSILQGLVSPDVILDKKRGMGTIVSRIITSLLMLALIAPMNISASNEWERQVNNNGLLFGTLFSLQNRILANNTIGRLIVGNNISEEFTSSKSLSETGRVFSTTVLKTFVGINTSPNSKEPVCSNINPGISNIIKSSKSSAGDILGIVNIGCSQAGSGSKSLFASVISDFIGNEHYAVYYFLGASTIAGVIIDVILIGYSIDVAIRVFKLAILRLIAPVPIIGHMSISAKEGKGEDAFSRWTQTLISTYIDLFIRLAVIYFGLFFVQLALNSKLGITNYNSSNVMINVFATLFIIIGLMLFIKQAPKYIKGALGIKDGGAGVGMTVLGTVAGQLQSGGTIFGKSGDKLGDRINDFRNFASTVNEEVAEKSFGDKSKGHGQAYNFRKDSIKKLQEDYDRDLRQEYYKRGLDLSGNTPYKKRLFENQKAEGAHTQKADLKANINDYDAARRKTPPVTGRGVAVRFNDNNHQQAPTSPPPTQQTSVQQNSQQQQNAQQQQQQNTQQGNPPTGPTP